MTTREREIVERPQRVPGTPQTAAQTAVPPMPFIFRYRGYAHPVPVDVSRTDPTAGEWTSSPTSWDGKVEDDGTEDPDETDDGSNPQTGVIADSGTQDDEE